jgi:hypothetical protein
MIPAYADAFRSHGVVFFCVNDSIPFDASVEEALRTCPNIPSAIFYFASARSLFQPNLNVRKSRQCAFIQTRMLLPTAAFAGPPCLITQCFSRALPRNAARLTLTAKDPVSVPKR